MSMMVKLEQLASHLIKQNTSNDIEAMKYFENLKDILSHNNKPRNRIKEAKSTRNNTPKEGGCFNGGKTILYMKI